MDKTTRLRPSVGARLFTASDVERAARLAAGAAIRNDREYWDVEKTQGPVFPLSVENAVHEATTAIAEEAPLFYSESEVRSMFQYTLGKEAVDAELAEALAAIGR